MEFHIIVLRMFVVFLLSSIFGFERQKSNKPIGFGTFIFVAVGSCALGLVASAISDNPLPLLGSIVTGIGFLGAGALIKNGSKIQGFTSAASIWIFSILGLSIGVGQYLIGFSVYTIILFVVIADKYLEIKGIGSYQKKLIIVASKSFGVNEISSILKGREHKLLSIELNNKEDTISVSYFVSGTKESLTELLSELSKKKNFHSVKVE